MLGANVSTVGGLINGFINGQKWQCQAIQIYVTLSRKWSVGELSSKAVNDFQTAWKNSDIEIVVAHVPYLVNLASRDSDLRFKSIQRLQLELNYCSRLGIQFLVLHPGSNIDKNFGLELIINGIKEVLAKDNGSTKILLETTAGQGNSLGSSFDELAYILAKVNNVRLGVCLDTCHVYVAGYDLVNHYNYVFEEFDRIIGLKKLKAIHLNDSKKGLSSHVDRHANIGDGVLGNLFFRKIVQDRRFLKLPLILEIPDRDDKTEDNLRVLRNWQT